MQQVMQQFVKWYFSPLLFGFAFLAPLISQTMVALGIETSLSPLIIGLAVGGSLGVMAQIRGSWLWIR